MAGLAVSENPGLMDQVKEIILRAASENGNFPLDLSSMTSESFGKMLRTNLAVSLLKGSIPGPGLAHVCAAVELVHTASLFHDDVIDGATLRRGRPALWKQFSTSGAIILGDVLLCKALLLLVSSEGRVHLQQFTEKVQEVCLAEAEQELMNRGTVCSFETSLKIARYKTGPLFAIIARACGYGDEKLAAALEEVGYKMGTVYQLADDLIDELGDDAVMGKTLGTDRLRRKFTIAHNGESAQDISRRTIRALCDESIEALAEWPERQNGLSAYINEVILPACGMALQTVSAS